MPAEPGSAAVGTPSSVTVRCADLLREPWMRPEILSWIADLEAAVPDGLDGMRRR
jgi:hypothetical protein